MHINIVWLKRDIRTQDQTALAAAEAAGLPYVIFYCFEPSLMNYPDCSERHLQFVYHSLLDFNQQLQAYNRRAFVFCAEAIDVFTFYLEDYTVREVFSYQESGTLISWERDKAVAKLLASSGVQWTEFQRDGIERGRKNRVAWDKLWYTRMHGPLTENSYSINTTDFALAPYPLLQDLSDQLQNYPSTFQPAGEQYAWRYLRSFAEDRGKNYHRFISKPLKSRKSCGRISVYLAWGNLSIAQAYQYLKQHPNYKLHKRAFQGICTRLKWHCHFIQKFEMECSYELYCVNKGYESLFYEEDEAKLQAWKDGQTGYPLVDACMRCLQQTGWINFRMRAMIVSFLCHNLHQDWRKGVYHIAQLFLDYEPGIHYTQFQMQAGTTGINTVRIYNPVKQSQDHDKEGKFIRQWVKELRAIPLQFIHEPWQMTLMEQELQGFRLGEDYPYPIVDLKKSAKIGRERIWGHRKNLQVKQEKKRILTKHVRPASSSSKKRK